jgi:hypothetical protein
MDSYDPQIPTRKKWTFIVVFLVEMLLIHSVAVVLGRKGLYFGVFLWAVMAALVIVLCTIIPMSISLKRSCATSVFNGIILLVGSIVAPMLAGISHYNTVYYANNVGGISVNQAMYYPTVNAFQFNDGEYLSQFIGSFYNVADDTTYLVTPLVSSTSKFDEVIYAWGVATQDNTKFKTGFSGNGERPDPIQVRHFRSAVTALLQQNPQLKAAAADLPLIKPTPDPLHQMLAQFTMLRIIGNVLFLACLTFFVGMNVTIFWGRTILRAFANFVANPPLLHLLRDKYVKKTRVVTTTFAAPPPEDSHADRPIGVVNPSDSPATESSQQISQPETV